MIAQEAARGLMVEAGKPGEFENPNADELITSLRTRAISGRLTRIMHEVRRFCAFGEQARADDPTGWIGCETTHCATRLG